MEYLSDAMLLCVVGVNLAIIMASCVLNIGTEKHSKKKNMKAIVILLTINLVLNVAFMAYFLVNGVVENGKVFVLFLPLTGWLLYETIKDEKARGNSR